MKFTIRNEKPAGIKTGCVILGVFEHRRLSEAASRFDKTTRGLLTRLLKDGEMDGSCGQTLMVHYPRGAACERVLLVGCGKAEKFNAGNFSSAVASAARSVEKSAPAGARPRAARAPSASPFQKSRFRAFKP